MNRNRLAKNIAENTTQTRSALLRKHQRAGFHVVHLEHADHHRGERAARQSEREQRDHRRTGGSIVCRLGRNHTLELALAEFFWCFRPAYRLVVTHEGSQRGADAGQDTAEESR